MQVAKWGNSLAVRIPRDIIRALNIKEGDDVQLRALRNGELAVVTERQLRAVALDELRAMAVPFPPDYKFDREEANAR